MSGYGCAFDSGLTYRECSSACSGSCRDAEISKNNCEEECIPGCHCPQENGKLNDHMKCVKLDSCPCYDKYNNKRHTHLVLLLKKDVQTGKYRFAKKS